MEQTRLEKWAEQGMAWLTEIDPIYLAAMGVGIMAIIFLFFAVRKGNKKRQPTLPPDFTLKNFQVSPLGRDAFFKLSNKGEAATLSKLNIKGRNDIMVKNNVAGHKIDKDKDYSILLEASTMNKIYDDFSLELTYLDKFGNVYQKEIPLDKKTSKK